MYIVLDRTINWNDLQYTLYFLMGKTNERITPLLNHVYFSFNSSLANCRDEELKQAFLIEVVRRWNWTEKNPTALDRPIELQPYMITPRLSTLKAGHSRAYRLALEIATSTEGLWNEAYYKRIHALPDQRTAPSFSFVTFYEAMTKRRNSATSR